MILKRLERLLLLVLTAASAIGVYFISPLGDPTFPAKAFSLQGTTTPRTFADWCLNKNNLSIETLHTVDVLLQETGTTDCHQASELLSARTELNLIGNQIADLKPLSTLTNLTELYIGNNPSLTDKTCPVKPESICGFVPFPI
jgi:Leucine-rich repeat (LRR) protein